MALEGTLKEFGIADILQLMAQQQKTGILIVESRDASVEFFFCGGAVVAAHAAGQDERMGELLVKAGLASEERVKSALEKKHETFDALGHILLREGCLQKDQLEKIVLALVYEAFCEVLQWRAGRYRFVPQAVRDETGLVALPGLESILLDVLRMIDEWPDVQKVVRSPDMVFAARDGAPVEELDEEEQAVYRLIDGKTPVGDIAAAGLMNRYAACKILCDLVQDGFIEAAAHQPRAAVKKKQTAAQAAAALAAYACLVLALAALLLAPVDRSRTLLPFLSAQAACTTLPGQWATRIAARQLETAVELYRLDRGAYPGGIAELVRSGFLSERRAGAIARRGIVYAPGPANNTIDTP
jgi:hypothetical protein